MVSLRTIYQVCQSGWRARPLEQFAFLAQADNNLAHIARHAPDIIQQGTSSDPLSTKIGPEIGLYPTTDFLYDLANDYVHHLMERDQKAFKAFLRTHLGESAVQEFEEKREVTINFNLNARHPIDYYGFLQQLSGWKKLNSTMSSMGIKAELFADAPEEDRRPLFAALTSTNGMPLRVLMKQSQAGILFPEKVIN